MLRVRNLLLAIAGAAATAACATQAPISGSPLLPSVALLWHPVSAETGRISDVPALTALANAFPESASVQRRLLSAAVRDKNAELARATLTRLEAMGYALRPQSFDALAPLIGDSEAKAAAARANERVKPVGISLELVTIDPRHRLVEGVATHETTGRMFLTSVVERALYTMDRNRPEPVPGVSGGSLSGVATDVPRGLLWIASGVVDQTPEPDTAFRGLIALDLTSLAGVRRVPAPAYSEFPSDIAVGADGAVYVSDATRGSVYRLRAGAGEMDILVPPGMLRSPQGIALHPNGRFAYISDYSYGIAVVELASGSISRLASSSPMMLDGIDGLYWFRGALIGIQNGTRPIRIVRIRLDHAGSNAVELKIVEASTPGWGEPTIGQISGADLIYLANPQWERFGPGGKLIGDGPLRPNAVRGTPLSEEAALPPAR